MSACFDPYLMAAISCSYLSTRRIALKLRRVDQKGVCQYSDRAASFKRLLAGLGEPFSPTFLPMIQDRHASLHVIFVV